MKRHFLVIPFALVSISTHGKDVGSIVTISASHAEIIELKDSYFVYPRSIKVHSGSSEERIYHSTRAYFIPKSEFQRSEAIRDAFKKGIKSDFLERCEPFDIPKFEYVFHSNLPRNHWHIYYQPEDCGENLLVKGDYSTWNRVFETGKPSYEFSPFYFLYDRQEKQWYHISDGLRERLNWWPHTQPIYSVVWLSEAFVARNRIRAEKGLPLLERNGWSLISREQADALYAEHIELNRKYGNPNIVAKKPVPAKTTQAPANPLGTPEKMRCTPTLSGLWVWLAFGSIFCSTGLFLWLKIRSRRKKS